MGYDQLIEEYLALPKQADRKYRVPNESLFVEKLLQNTDQLTFGIFVAFFGLGYQRRTKHEIAEILNIHPGKIDKAVNKVLSNVQQCPQKYGLHVATVMLSEDEAMCAFLKACITHEAKKAFSSKNLYVETKERALGCSFIVESTCRVGRFGVFNTVFKVTPEGIAFMENHVKEKFDDRDWQI